MLFNKAAEAMFGWSRADSVAVTLAAFIPDRYRAAHARDVEFVLPMTREEISSHLGLKLETVSRLLPRFADEGLILSPAA